MNLLKKPEFYTTVGNPYGGKVTRIYEDEESSERPAAANIEVWHSEQRIKVSCDFSVTNSADLDHWTADRIEVWSEMMAYAVAICRGEVAA